jgi:hypothetical protein
MERIRPHVKVGSSHDAEASPRRSRVPGAAQHFASARAASHPGHAIASDAFGALFTFQTAQIFSFPRRVFAPGFCHLTFTHPEPKGWAERRRAHLVVVVAPAKARVGRACETRRASCEACMTRSPLGAPPWRPSPRPRSAFGSFPETPSTSGDAHVSSMDTIRSQERS